MNKELKQYSNETKQAKLESLKLEGTIKHLDIVDQNVVSVDTEVPKELDKISKEDKMDFEAYKNVYKDLIDEACTSEYGNCEDTKLWEDTAKEMYLKSSNYIPAGDEYKPKEDLDTVEKIEESVKLEERIKLTDTEIELLRNRLRNEVVKYQKFKNEEELEAYLDEFMPMWIEMQENLGERVTESRDRVAENLSKFIYKLTSEKDSEEYGYTAWSGNGPMKVAGMTVYEVYRNGKSTFSIEDIEKAVLAEFPELRVHGHSASGNNIWFERKQKKQESKYDKEPSEDRYKDLIEKCFDWIENHIHADDYEAMLDQLDVSQKSFDESRVNPTRYEKVVNNALSWIMDHTSEEENTIKEQLGLTSDEITFFGITFDSELRESKLQEDQYDAERRKGRPNAAKIAQMIYDEEPDWWDNHKADYKTAEELIEKEKVELASEWNLKEDIVEEVCKHIFNIINTNKIEETIESE